MFQEFKKFAMRGNVIDLAVGVVIGTAFGGIVNSLVTDVIMPPIGVLTGGVDFSDLFLTIKGPAMDTLAQAQKAGAVTINYGVFVNAVINFLIIAAAIFMVVRAINKLQAPPPPAAADAPPPPEDILLLREIRDSLKSRA
jgi:large conductance mechanosensitive channel